MYSLGKMLKIYVVEWHRISYLVHTLISRTQFWQTTGGRRGFLLAKAWDWVCKLWMRLELKTELCNWINAVTVFSIIG